MHSLTSIYPQWYMALVLQLIMTFFLNNQSKHKIQFNVPLVTHMLVMRHGYTDDFSLDEARSPSRTGLAPSIPPSITYSIFQATGTLPCGTMIACGGWTFEPAAECWVFDPLELQYRPVTSMAMGRWDPEGQVLLDGRFWITGGKKVCQAYM